MSWLINCDLGRLFCRVSMSQINNPILQFNTQNGDFML